MLDVKRAALRSLSGLQCFSADGPSNGDRFTDEALIGCYQSSPDSYVLFIHSGMHIYNGEKKSVVRYEDIVQVTLPILQNYGWKQEIDRNKKNRHLNFTLNTGSTVTVPFENETGHSLDVLVVKRFLDKVVFFENKKRLSNSKNMTWSLLD